MRSAAAVFGLLSCVAALGCSETDPIKEPQWEYLYDTLSGEHVYVDKSSASKRDGARTVWVRIGYDRQQWAFRCGDATVAYVKDVEKLKFAPIAPDSVAADIYNGACAGKWPEPPLRGGGRNASNDEAAENLDANMMVDSGPPPNVQ